MGPWVPTNMFAPVQGVHPKKEVVVVGALLILQWSFWNYIMDLDQLKKMKQHHDSRGL